MIRGERDICCSSRKESGSCCRREIVFPGEELGGIAESCNITAELVSSTFSPEGIRPIIKGEGRKITHVHDGVLCGFLALGFRYGEFVPTDPEGDTADDEEGGCSRREESEESPMIYPIRIPASDPALVVEGEESIDLKDGEQVLCRGVEWNEENIERCLPEMRKNSNSTADKPPREKDARNRIVMESECDTEVDRA